MTFLEAVQAMKEGKNVRRKSWKHLNRFLWAEDEDSQINNSLYGLNLLITPEDIEATDWEIWKETE